MSNITEITKDCPREDCSISFSGGTTTLMCYTQTYDRFGNRTDGGDPNISSHSAHCGACGRDWTIRRQNGVTLISLDSPP